jgi:cytochrome c-type biogenesis protein
LNIEVDISLFLALSAGALSFVSPCVLPLVPAYVSYLAGVDIASDKPSTLQRWVVFLHALGFVLGFSAIFIFLGASVGLVGYLFYDLQGILRRLGGIILVVFGLHTMGLLKIPFLYREFRFRATSIQRWGIASSFVVGIIFAAAWTPCVGPILSGILVLAGTSGSAGRGALLLSVYSLGLGIPFLLTGLSLGWAVPLLRRLNRYGQIVSIVSGVLLVGMGVLVFTDTLSTLTGFLSRYLDPPL